MITEILVSKDTSSYLDNFLAGTSATLMGLPGNIIFGMLAFAPLGADYISFGILSSLIGAVVVGVISTFFCSTKGLIVGPRPPIALLLASVMAIFSASLAAQDQVVNPFLVLSYGFIIAALSGVIQILFGHYKLGSLVRFIPVTVISGFVAASSVVIVVGQLWNITGIPAKSSLLEFSTSLHQIESGAVIIALFSAIVTWNASLFIKKMPVGILGIIFGSIVYYSLCQLYPGVSYGGTLQTTSISVLEIISIPSKHIFTGFDWTPYIFAIISSAFGMALLSSVDTLLTSAAMDNMSLKRSSHNMDLKAQGYANLVSAFLGGVMWFRKNCS